MNPYKLSTHARFVAGSIAIVFVGSLITQPAIVAWLSSHKIVDAFVTAAGVAFNAYTTYAQPKSNLPSGTFGPA